MTNESTQNNTQAGTTSPSRAPNANPRKQSLSKPGIGKPGKVRARSADKTVNISGNSGGFRRPEAGTIDASTVEAGTVPALHISADSTHMQTPGPLWTIDGTFQKKVVSMPLKNPSISVVTEVESRPRNCDATASENGRPAHASRPRPDRYV
jgi:hypothetical protein